MRYAAVAMLLVLLPAPRGADARPRILLVCNGSTAPCPRGAHFKTIADAVARAKANSWILVWPGVYHEKATPSAGVLITKPNIHLRGMDRNLVVVDGTNGVGSQPCPSAAALQDLTPRNGVEVLKVDGTSIDNLTVCNYLSSDAGAEGNEIWWNGGERSAWGRTRAAI